MARLLWLIALTTWFLIKAPVYAQNSASRTDLENKIQEYQQKLGEIGQQKNTLSSQIQYMDTQIYLTGLKIQETEAKIASTQKEIDLLTSKIEGLDQSLTYLSKLLLQRIVIGYKQRQVSFLSLLLDSGNAQELLTKLKYFKTTQEDNQKTLIRVQETKLNFEEQKKLREQKKVELDQLSQTLEEQKITLDSQKKQKQKLLADTQNDEATYQRLLANAEAQLQAFKSFVQGSGVGVISANQLGTGSDGNYYSQRDERWAYKTIGYSNENVLDVGCLLTSISMVAKKNGQNVTPLDIAADTSRFWANTAWMNYPWPGVAGKSMVQVNDIDSELNSGNYVIAGVMINNCNYGGNHYVVLTKKDGDDYIMHDPIYGPDIKFHQYYSTICSAATFK
ncbi:hypothetical protein M1523_02410 [Patescibacteria group bacterium]|nr:hypothetical protein [Patescibacteria group bacterium]MCL5091426.1 hypothetical protein [Patescibacteria group bacterium]